MSYENAIELLTSLESNAQLIRRLKEDPMFRQTMILQNVPSTRKYLETILGHEDFEKKLENLKIIHISGTKGKGSTCSYIEKILRDQGFKTGLYTSPHLINIRERIRINGENVEKDIFAREFFNIYEELQKEGDLPGFFQFLTILAFHIFIQVEKVDVAIIEVGMGGEYDATNFIQNPVVCGITTLDLDHLNVMVGKAEENMTDEEILAQIAWHKSGIFKENVPAFYMPVDGIKAEEVIKSRAAAKNTPLHLALPITTFKFARQITPGIPGDHQFANISLALRIVQTWMNRTENPQQIGDLVSDKVCDSLENCRLAGRCQKIEKTLGENGRKITWLLDGAHTPKSMECCAKWAEQEMVKLGERKRLLLVHCPDRSPDVLLPFLKPLNFSQVITCPTKYSPNISEAQKCLDTWYKFARDENSNFDGRLFESIAESVDFIANSDRDLVVLVAGNIHLVGGVIEKLDG